jgi:hypothetical protein
MKTLSKLALAIAVTGLFVSCSGIEGIRGSGNVITQNRNVSDFTSVKAEKGLDVTIDQGNEFQVAVEADDNVQPHIITKVENGTLIITSDYNSYTNVTKNISVKMPVIKSLETGSGASLKSKNILRSDDIIVKSASGSSMGLNVESDKITAESSSGSTLSLLGKALTFDSSSSSGSSIDAQNLIANDVSARSSSGSSTSVHAAVSLNAHASSGSSIEYKGKPKNVTVDQSSGGGVSGI